VNHDGYGGTPPDRVLAAYEWVSIQDLPLSARPRRTWPP
jgi:hypothetical protein